MRADQPPGHREPARGAQGAAEGEKLSPTQPFPTKPPAFVRQSFTVDDVNQWLLTPEQYQTMRDRVAKAKNVMLL